MGRSLISRSAAAVIVALFGTALTVACDPNGEPEPCEGSAVDGLATLKEGATSRTGETPCVVSVYGDSIGTDTSTQTTLFVVDSIGTDTSSAAGRANCVGRFMAEGHAVSTKDGPADGACRVRAYFDSIGTDTSTTPARVLYRFDSIGTDTSSHSP